MRQNSLKKRMFCHFQHFPSWQFQLIMKYHKTFFHCLYHHPPLQATKYFGANCLQSILSWRQVLPIPTFLYIIKYSNIVNSGSFGSQVLKVDDNLRNNFRHENWFCWTWNMKSETSEQSCVSPQMKWSVIIHQYQY